MNGKKIKTTCHPRGSRKIRESSMTIVSCNKIKCHPRGFLSGISRLLPLSNQGFTLIELLVVVLIIGILAAIALPQYQKAVLKSRFNALKPTADAIRTSQEAYFMENGVYAEDMADLPIKIENSQEDTQITFSDIDEHEFVRASNPNTKNRYTVYLNHSVNFAGNTYCEAPSHEGGETLEDRVCINEGGHDPVSSSDNYTMYLLTGTSTGRFPKVITPLALVTPITLTTSILEDISSCVSGGESSDCWADFYNSLLDGEYEDTWNYTLSNKCQPTWSNYCFEQGNWSYRMSNGSSGDLHASIDNEFGTATFRIEIRTFGTINDNPSVWCNGAGCQKYGGQKRSWEEFQTLMANEF